MAKGSEQFFQFIVFAFCEHFYAFIPAIAHPAGLSLTVGLFQ
jgi:hypothetical protein